MDHGLWLLSEEDFSWNCYTGTLSFDGGYNSCKTGYQSISSTDTLLESIKTILEEVFTALAWITRSQDSFPME